MMLNTVSRGMLVHLRHVSIVMLTWRLFELKFLFKVALTNTVMRLSNRQLLEKQEALKVPTLFRTVDDEQPSAFPSFLPVALFFPLNL